MDSRFLGELPKSIFYFYYAVYLMHYRNIIKSLTIIFVGWAATMSMRSLCAGTSAPKRAGTPHRETGTLRHETRARGHHSPPGALY